MKRPAFTLIEVIIALAIIAGLSVGVGAFVRDVRIQQRTLTRLGSQLEQCSALFELTERAMMTCVADGGPGVSGVSGDATTLRIHYRSVELRNPGRLSDTAHLGITFDQGGARIHIALSSPGSGAPESSEVVCDRIERVQFRYHDGRNWVESFDTLKARTLPNAVEMAIWFQSESPTPKTSPDLSEGLGAPPEAGDAERLRPPDRVRIISVHDASPPAERSAS